VTYGNSKLALISALGISTVANNIGPLLDNISPAQAMYRAGYTYDHTIIYFIIRSYVYQTWYVACAGL